MSTVSSKSTIIYPDSDGMPMADNTLQFRWIVTIKENLELLFAERPDVFVAGDLLWYPVEGDPTIRQAPDVLVVFGRPKGYRGSYRQWQEDGLAPQVVFEILSPGNRLGEMQRKFQFYWSYGVEEYYIYDPDSGELVGSLRDGNMLQDIPAMHGWVSPRLGIRFDTSGPELKIFRPDDGPFLTFLELAQQHQEAQREIERLRARLKAQGIDPDANP